MIDRNNLVADPGFIFESGKTYTHSVGLSCAFRQWRAHSHCRLIHGYALQVTFVFRSTELNEQNWVVDFGGMKSLKGWLEDMFDHTMVVAEDDPEMPLFKIMAEHKIIDLRVLPNVGMEACSYYIYQYAEQWLKDNGFHKVILQEVEVREHESNFARYRRNS